MKILVILMMILTLMAQSSCKMTCSKGTASVPLAVVSECRIDGKLVPNGGRVSGVPLEGTEIIVRFSDEIDVERSDKRKISLSGIISDDISVSYGVDRQTLVIRPLRPLPPLEIMRFHISKGTNLGIELDDSFECELVTAVNPSMKYPEIPEEDLLTKVQESTFSYFWDYAHPVSGLARERSGSGDLVTVGGSGFAAMAIPVAVERGFITREEGASRLLRMVRFLYEQADRFHGVFPHWLDGTDGKTIPFSQKDDGGDLVETSLLLQGLLTASEYFNSSSPVEMQFRRIVDMIWQEVEWEWYMNGQQKLFWHWSPDYGWEMNLPVTGWNEALITYVLAASSPTHQIDRSVYDAGWARYGEMRNGKSFFDICLPLGPDFGGPLFFAHYSFLGLDPRGLSDAYADYWEQNVAHSLINYRYCVSNPRGWYGYGKEVWGLTACDIPGGYAANSPAYDTGTIAPTAALSSIPYTPEESLSALKYYYYILGDRLFGEYGFFDSFNLEKAWISSTCLAIDQGPVIIMIENYRTGLLWKLFMDNEYVQNGLSRLGFTTEPKL